jgi:1,4-alpha-glucan branching enzyme
MIRFLASTRLARPGLHVWRANTDLRLYLHPLRDAQVPDGFTAFECELGVDPQEEIYCLLFQWSASGVEQQDWEQETHIHRVPRLDGNRLPPVVWLFHGSARAVAQDPIGAQQDQVRIHLVTAARYLHGELLLWGIPDGDGSWRPASGHDALGPFWDVGLSDRARSFFQFKFRRPTADGWGEEPDIANRVWVAQDGQEVWTHSEGRDLASTTPVPRELAIHFRQEIDPAHPPRMRIWQPGSDWEEDRPAEADGDGWTLHRALVYTSLPYRFKFWNPTLEPHIRWEHDEATREVVIDAASQYWTLEGDRHLFPARPERSAQLDVTVSLQPPGFELAMPHGAEVWVNRARGQLREAQELSFATYPQVVTSFRVIGTDRAERIDRHYIRAPDGRSGGFVVLGRPPVLAAAPAPDQFRDPPFPIRRPGAFEEDGQLRFVLHAPWCARVDLVAEWMGPGATVAMHSTLDGSYWWAQVDLAAVAASLPPEFRGDYHGARYRYHLNGDPASPAQDPAAGWVAGSGPTGWSRLVRSGAFTWNEGGWQTPSWDSLRLYQLHPARFSERRSDLTPFQQVKWEIENPGGYLRQLKVNALQLMPVNEVGTSNSWGYDPAFFYAVEQGYGGPDDFKALVDACHRNGIAVLVDVVFNHAGTTDNSLWPTAQASFFDGDTAWGAMINFDNQFVLDFFEQNIVYMLREYHVDGFRFDFTRVIVHGNDPHEAHVRVAGSGGGWEFLHRLRRAARAVNPDCILIAEHLPNEWAVTNFGGPMDSQWCDDFHDRLKQACAGDLWVVPRLGEALLLSHVACDDWYKTTNYAESHDEVGNENGRIANVARFGYGLRLAKVAMTATLASRGLPMFFMGAEVGEHQQFFNGSATALDLDHYLNDTHSRRLRDWTNALLGLRGNENVKGPSPLRVVHAAEQKLALTRGMASEYFFLLNFGGWAGWQSLADLGLPDGVYRELWNSTWPAFQVEGEDEHGSGGRDAHLHRGGAVHVPDYGAVVLERI